MNFSPLPLLGAFIIEPELHADQRGFFGRTYCREEFIAHGLSPAVAQSSISFNKEEGTLRGLHYQTKPYEEAKLVRCTQGAIYDVIVDLRLESATFKQWIGVELTAVNRKSLYVPEGFAHGFLTLTSDSEVFYQISEMFHSECAMGVRWDDKAFGIAWPGTPKVISLRDTQYPDYCPMIGGDALQS